MTKEARLYDGGKTVSSVNVVGKIGQTTCKWIKLEYRLTSHTQINSKWIKNLNMRPYIVKLLEEK